MVKKLVYLSLLVAMALALSLLENVIPLPFVAPGAKLGLSNMVILISLAVFGFSEALIVAVLKSIVLMLATGSVSSLAYSLIGGVMAVLLMELGYRFLHKYLSFIGISILGSAGHNLGQILVATFITENIKMFNYLPLLLIVGIFTGYFVGLGSSKVIRHMKKLTIDYRGGPDV